MTGRSIEEKGDRRNMIIIGLAIIVMLALVGYGLHSMLGEKGSTSKKPPKISLIPATPPPPPPPKEESGRNLQKSRRR